MEGVLVMVPRVYTVRDHHDVGDVQPRQSNSRDSEWGGKWGEMLE